MLLQTNDFEFQPFFADNTVVVTCKVIDNFWLVAQHIEIPVTKAVNSSSILSRVKPNIQKLAFTALCLIFSVEQPRLVKS